MDGSDWKAHLYQSYVSSGQVQDSNTSAAEHFRSPRAHLTAIVRRHFPADRKTPIVDIGCGHGTLLYFLREADYENARGVDTSAEQAALAQRLGVPGVECGDAMSFLRALPDGAVGVVCLFDVMEHLTRAEAFAMAEEVRRVLAPEGRCIGHVPNAEGLFGMRIRYGDLTHEQAFTKKSVEQMFRSLGFDGVDCFEDKPIAHGLKSLARRVIWDAGTLPFRLLLTAETGTRGFILSQNFLFVARK
jgi:SAM-dependent methyltransferase